jgi:DNA mismatch endonuclease (patch repair protein)
MSRIKSRDTSPEILLRRILFRKGLRYRINYKLEGKPDLVFPSKKIAIFVHGCFWHQHGCNDTYRPKTNKKFWNKKLDENIKRDKEVKKILIRDNWRVFYVWECEINKNLEKYSQKMADQIQ